MKSDNKEKLMFAIIRNVSHPGQVYNSLQGDAILMYATFSRLQCNRSCEGDQLDRQECKEFHTETV